MYSLKLEAPWEDVKELIKETNHELTDDDLQYAPGKDEELIKRLAAKMNRSNEDIKGWIESVSHTRGKAS